MLLPGTGRGTIGWMGQGDGREGCAPRPHPSDSVLCCHLPVPGRI